ncbi:MAG: hypothetical protein A2X64_02325 [Ignavibacteria bacterium GWF2_33_9]|nr:MAG: hypothetical protein A2X64_02325 [Ignavibacteria bacterium GWF2_33_9]
MDSIAIMASNSNLMYLDFSIKFIINLIAIIFLSGVIYYRRYKDNDYFFVMMVFNLVVFFIGYLLSSVQLSMGFAFGIFAVFSLLRYRTQVIPTKEMTFLFAAITIGIINSVQFQNFSKVFVIFSNSIIIFTIYILELIWTKSEKSKDGILEKIELIKPENYNLLMEDMKKRTGLNITRIEIGRIDFVKDIANIKIYYTER